MGAVRHGSGLRRAGVVCTLTVCMVLCQVWAGSSQKNVLLIVVDDLRPQLGAYGQTMLKTPHMDALASQSLVFDRAYVNFAYCAPSRNSFLSGRRPDTTGCWNFINNFRERGEDWVALPQHFKQNGYWTTGSGKVYHPKLPPDFDYPKSWSDPWAYYAERPCNDTAVCDLPKDDFVGVDDTEIADTVIAQLTAVANGTRPGPFFIAGGLHHPHLSWSAPQWSFDSLGPASGIATAKHPHHPINGSYAAWHSCLSANASNWGNWTDLTHHFTYDDPMPASEAQYLRRGYYASVQFTDQQVGRMVQALDDLGLADDTIVALVADHGWQLGEHNQWCKMTVFELGVRIPMLFRVPGASAMGKRTSSIVEIIDVYRTLSDLAGLPTPEAGVNGTSFAHLMNDPSATVTGMAFSQFPRCYTSPTVWNPFNTDCHYTPRGQFDLMGYSVRTDRWRYTEWVEWDRGQLAPRWDRRNSTELYDHLGDRGDDFDAFENVNLAGLPEHAALERELHALLCQGFPTPTATVECSSVVA